MEKIQAISLKDIEYLHNQFMLFGDPISPYWFVGLEEGEAVRDGQSVDAFVSKLIEKTRNLEIAEKLSLRDLCGGGTHDYLPPLNNGEAIDGSGTSYQTTWGGYIKLLLSVDRSLTGDNSAWSLDDVKRYQKHFLGSLNVPVGEPKSCLMELYPMARKGHKTSQWPYAELADRDGLEFLESAKRYLRYATKPRASKLIELVARHSPKYVFCFGSRVRDGLMCQLESHTINVVIKKRKKSLRIPVVFKGETTYIFSCHPAANMMSDENWCFLGEKVAELRKQQFDV